jgi:cellulose synthase/poly-beta-1,6-N-acetylglucosamine synthase-like glycosyltransferase
MDLLYVLAILISPYLALGLIILTKGRNCKIAKDYGYQPSVAIYLPTYNEEKNIAKKLDNLVSQTYPIKEILILDCSTDSTVKIIEQYQRRYSNIRLVKQAQRTGAARTMNEAMDIVSKEKTAEIFVKTDCDSLSGPEALRELIANFVDPKVGAVTGIYVIDRGVEKYYRRFMHSIQIAESNIDSTLIAHSCWLAFRTSLLEPVRQNSAAEDTEEFLLVRRKGFKTIIDPSVISSEEVPDNYKLRITQKSRRSQGIVRILQDNLNMLFHPKFRKYGTIILPIEWFILVLSPVLLIALTGVITYLLYLTNPLLALSLVAVIVGAVIHRSNIIFAIIDTEFQGLTGFLKSVLRGNGDGLWERVR